jgi:putative ABC transport system substrate-binding protein
MRLLRRVVASACLVITTLAAVYSTSYAEQKPQPRVGVILPQSSTLEQRLRDQLSARGLIDGKSVVLEWRYYRGWDTSMRRVAAELVRSAPNVIVVFGTPPARAVLDETKSIPVVFAAGDPVATGLVSSLSRPGGNATGASVNAVELSAKLLDLVTQLVPGAHRILAVRNPSNPLSLQMVDQVQKLSQALRVEILVMDANSAYDLVKGLGRMNKHKIDAILIPPDLVFQIERERVVQAVRATGLPAIYQDHVYAEIGGLLCYAPDQREITQSVVTLVEKILKGANPADLPVEQVSKLRLVVNLRTAKEMRIVMPESILTRADEVIR